MTQAQPQHDCFSSSTKILQAQLYTPQREYIVCPDTIIRVGRPTSSGNFDNGEWPLMALGPNVHIKCGIDGSSRNNCTIDSSSIHVWTKPSFPELNLDNIRTDNLLVSGFFFTGDFQEVDNNKNNNDDDDDLFAVSVLIQTPGSNMIFEDCVWGNTILYDGLRVREKASSDNNNNNNMDLTMDVTIQNSHFFNLAYFGDLVWADRQRLTIQQTKFENITALSDPSVDKAATAIRCDAVSNKAYCTIRDCCFQDVAIEGAMIQAYGNGGRNKVVLDFERNYVDNLIPLDGHEARGVCVKFVVQVGQDSTEWASIHTKAEEDDPAVEYCIQLNTIDTCPLGSLLNEVDSSSSSHRYRGGKSALGRAALWTLFSILASLALPILILG